MKPTFTDREIVDVAIVHGVYSQVEKALDELANDDRKQAVVTLRRLLPYRYRWSFEKRKQD